jgi:hypothetical protein
MYETTYSPTSLKRHSENWTEWAAHSLSMEKINFKGGNEEGFGEGFE